MWTTVAAIVIAWFLIAAIPSILAVIAYAVVAIGLKLTRAAGASGDHSHQVQRKWPTNSKCVGHALGEDYARNSSMEASGSY